MPKEFKEIRLFNKGTIRNIDETDAPDESASFSLNLDPNTENGVLQGKKADGIITSTGLNDSGTPIDPEVSSNTSKGDSIAVLKVGSIYDAIYYDDNVIKEIRNIFRGQGSTSTGTVSVETVKDGSYNNNGSYVAGTDNSSLTNSNDITTMEVNNTAVHIGMDDGDSKWVGVIKHGQFGHYQSTNGTSSGGFNPVIQDAALNPPDSFPELQWVVHSVGANQAGYIYGAEWKGHYIHRFRYDKTNGQYSYLGKSVHRFNSIQGIAARQARASESGEQGVWVYDSGVGSYGTVYEYLTGSLDKVINTHQIANIYYQGTTVDKFFDKSKVGGICESYNDIGGSGYLFFSKWLRNEPIVDPSDSETTSNSTTTSEYLQSSFLWRTSVTTANISANASLTLNNITPHLLSDMDKARAGSFEGFEHVYLANPANTNTNANTGVGVGGSGMLQCGENGTDFLDTDDGFHTGKKFGTQGGTAAFTDDGGGTSTITPIYNHLKCDPWPSTPWHSTGYNGCGVTDRKFTEEEQRKDTIGLLFANYNNHENTTANDCGGVAVAGYNKGKGYWTDSGSEDTSSGEKGDVEDVFGNTHATATTNLAYGSGTQDTRATGFLYNSDPDADFAQPLNNNGAGLFAPDDKAGTESASNMSAIDTYNKLYFVNVGLILYCYHYNNRGELTLKSSLDITTLSANVDNNSSSLFQRMNGGGYIDTNMKVLLWGAAADAWLGMISYTSNGDMTAIHTPSTNSGNLASYFADNTSQSISDAALCSFTKTAFIIAEGRGTGADVGYILGNPYSNTSGLPNFTQRVRNSTNFADESTHKWDPDASEQVAAATLGLDNTFLDWNDDNKNGLLFYTSNGSSGGSDGNRFITCVKYNNAGELDFTDMTELDMGEKGAALGFKVDPVNKVLYGSNMQNGMWTAKYNENGNMAIISSVRSGRYGNTSVSGVGGGTSINLAGTGGDDPVSDFQESSSYGQQGAVQLAAVNIYNEGLGLDDSYCTSYIMFHAMTANTSGDNRPAYLVGSIYNFQAHHIEVPKNALFPSATSNFQPLLLRTNGYSFNNSGANTYTRDNSNNGFEAGDSGVSGNMCGFNDTAEDDVKSTTWSALMIKSDESVDSTTKTVHDGVDYPISETKVAYNALRQSLANDTDATMKNRTQFVWATPYSAALVDTDNDTSIDAALVITCGNPGANDVNSVLIRTKLATSNDVSDDTMNGVVGIKNSGTNLELVEKLPSPKAVGNGEYYSDVSGNQGRINLFAGENIGRWYTIPANDDSGAIASGDTASDIFGSATPTFTERVPGLTQISLELDNEGNGYQTSTVGAVFYKVSYLYDGFQESPLSESTVIELTENADIKATVLVSDVERLQRYFARVSHIRLYRATNPEYTDSNPKPIGFYRLVEQLKLDGGIFGPQSGETNKWQAVVTDNNQVSASYESNTGIPEVITDTSMKYGLSTQINNMHIVGKASNSLDPDITDNMLFKSRPYNFDQFNVVADRLMLPFTPTAIKGYNGRIYAFDINQTCRIEPNQFYIEDVYQGAGCISPKTVITTEYGMFYCDENHIYRHDGNRPSIISQPIQGGTYAWNQRSIPTVVKNDVIAYDASSHTVLFYFPTYDDVDTNTELVIDSDQDTPSNLHSYAWGYNIPNQRWDLIYQGIITGSGSSPKMAITSPSGYANIFDSNEIRVIGGHTTDRKNWWWHSKDIDFGARTLAKKLSRVKISGTGSSLGGTIGLQEDDSHPNASPGERVIIEKDGVENETEANYSGKSQTSGETSFKLIGANGNGKRFKIKLENQDKAKKVSGIGLVYRIKGYR